MKVWELLEILEKADKNADVMLYREDSNTAIDIKIGAIDNETYTIQVVYLYADC